MTRIDSIRRYKLNDLFFSLSEHEDKSWITKSFLQIKDHCQSLGFEFQLIEIGYDPATGGHVTSELYLQEFQSCMDLSTGLNFIVSYIFFTSRILKLDIVFCFVYGA